MTYILERNHASGKSVGSELPYSMSSLYLHTLSCSRSHTRTNARTLFLAHMRAHFRTHSFSHTCAHTHALGPNSRILVLFENCFILTILLSLSSIEMMKNIWRRQHLVRYRQSWHSSRAPASTSRGCGFESLVLGFFLFMSSQ